MMSELKKHLRQPVLIEVCQTQCLSGQQTLVIEEQAEGTLYQIDANTTIVAYEMVINQRKKTVTAKLAGGVLSVVHIGDVHCRQTFAKDEWYASQFFFEGGSLICRNFTKKLDYAFSPDGGLIDVLYELWSGDTSMGYYNLELFMHAT